MKESARRSEVYQPISHAMTAKACSRCNGQKGRKCSRYRVSGEGGNGALSRRQLNFNISSGAGSRRWAYRASPVSRTSRS